MMKNKRRKILIITIVAVLLAVFFYLQNTWLVVTPYVYADEKVPEAFDGFRIVQISDLHNAGFGKDNERLISRIRELQPDMIVITGDVVDSNHTDVERALQFAKEAADMAPTYYVTGNHEGWLSDADRKKLFDGLQEAGVICPEDEALALAEGEDMLWLIGLKDESLRGVTLGKLTEPMEKDSFKILLAHEPQYFDKYSACEVDLVLTGHAHGGQFRIPGAGGLIAPDQGFFPQYTEGVHTQKNTTMIISRGLGNSVVPFRLFNLPEIVCLDLKKE